MNYKIHKNTKLTEISRKDIWNKYRTWIKAKDLASIYNVSTVTIYKVIKRAKLNDFTRPCPSNCVKLKKEKKKIEYGTKHTLFI